MYSCIDSYFKGYMVRGALANLMCHLLSIEMKLWNGQFMNYISLHGLLATSIGSYTTFFHMHAHTKAQTLLNSRKSF